MGKSVGSIKGFSLHQKASKHPKVKLAPILAGFGHAEVFQDRRSRALVWQVLGKGALLVPPSFCYTPSDLPCPFCLKEEMEPGTVVHLQSQHSGGSQVGSQIRLHTDTLPKKGRTGCGGRGEGELASQAWLKGFSLSAIRTLVSPPPPLVGCYRDGPGCQAKPPAA